MLFIAGLLLFLCGCAKTETNEAVEPEERSERLQIGMSFDSFVIERWLRDRDQFELTARDLGAEVNVQVANGDIEEQIAQIKYFIRKKMDVIVVIAVDGSALKEVVSEAKRNGIKVISYDRLLREGKSDLYISFDNEAVGRLMAESLSQALHGEGNIFTIYGSPSDYNVTQVREGLTKVLEDSSIRVVYENYCDNWLAELAFDAVEEGLSKTPRNLSGVICGNDDLASQAFRALAENRLAGKVVLVGQDAELSACQRIVEGTQYMTVYKSVEQLAMKAAEFACVIGYQKLLDEKKIREEELPEKFEEIRNELEHLETINDGSEEIPYYKIDPVAVTKENIDEVIIESGFHSREDVYLNIKP